MAINQGRYNVFKEDGTLFMWGKEKVSATVTPNNRVQIFIGDNMEPVVEKHIPARIQNVPDFDKFTLSVCEYALVQYVTLLVEKLHQYQEAYRLILLQKTNDHVALSLNLMPAWRWIEKVLELNEYQDICEKLLMDTMGTLNELAPEQFFGSVTFIYTRN